MAVFGLIAEWEEKGIKEMKLFDEMERVVRRPRPFEHYTSPQLWNDSHISKGMLDAHLDQGHDAASYRKELIDKGVDWMASRFDISEETRICDFGCGPGLWTIRFAERGASVTGVDLSERSIGYARNVATEKSLSIRYVLQDYFEFSTDDRYDLITMIHGDFSVLSPDQRKALLRIFRTQLSEGGKLLIEVSSMAHFREATEETCYKHFSSDEYWSAGVHHLFTSNFKYEGERVVCDKYTVIDEDRKLEIYVWVQCYSVESLKEVFEQNGLQIAECFSDVAGAPLDDDSPRIVAVAMKST